MKRGGRRRRDRARRRSRRHSTSQETSETTLAKVESAAIGPGAAPPTVALTSLALSHVERVLGLSFQRSVVLERNGDSMELDGLALDRSARAVLVEIRILSRQLILGPRQLCEQIIHHAHKFERISGRLPRFVVCLVTPQRIELRPEWLDVVQKLLRSADIEGQIIAVGAEELGDGVNHPSAPTPTRAKNDHSPKTQDDGPAGSFKEAVRSYEVTMILNALNRANGDRASAARMLNMNPDTLLKKIAKLGVEEERSQTTRAGTKSTTVNEPLLDENVDVMITDPDEDHWNYGQEDNRATRASSKPKPD